HHTDLETGQLWAALVDPSNPQNMYVVNGYGNGPTVYKSTNGGVDWAPLSPDVSNVLGYHDNFVQAIAMDPTNSEHLAVTFHDNCGAPFQPLCMSQSTDGGNTWTEFNGPSELTGWQEGATLTVLGATNYLYGCGAGVW